MTPVTIQHLEIGKIWQRIRLRVVRILRHPFPERNKLQRPNSLFALAFVGTDSEKGAIHVQIKTTPIAKFMPILLEDSLYMLSNFNVMEPRGKYIAFRSHKIHRISDMIPIKGNLCLYPTYWFDFVPERCLCRMTRGEIFLADVIGSLMFFTDEDKYFHPKIIFKEKIRTYKIKTLRNEEISVILADEQMNLINEEQLEAVDHRPVILFAGMLPKLDRDGYLYLIATSATKVWIEPDIKEVKEIHLKDGIYFQ